MSETAHVDIGDGFRTLIDSDDVPVVAGFPWRALKGHNGKVYAYAKRSGTGVYMHRLIARTAPGLETDHINGDGLDNRRANLRPATAGQNSANTGKPRLARPVSSKFKGVSWSVERRRWCAFIAVNGRTRNLGRYHSEREAAEAYDAAAIEAWGEFAFLNLPRDAA